MIYELVLLPYFLALIVSLAITVLTIKVYRGLGWIDRSNAQVHPKNIHTTPVPRGGGIPIFVAMLFVGLSMTVVDVRVASIYLGAGIILILGIMDDVYNLSPYVRLILGGVVSLIVVSSGVAVEFVTSPVGGVWILPTILSVGVSVIWIMWAMNFVNMGAKGLDGQLPGVVVIAAVVMGLLGLRFVGDERLDASVITAFALAGAYSGLLWFNVYPQKIMPGWGGGALAGYFLAVLSMMAGTKVATALIVLGIPLMDVCYAILRRILAGKSPVWGDNMHLHHQLLALGWSKRRVALFYWVLTAILGLIALQIDAKAKFYTIVMLAVVMGGVLLWINLFLSQKRSA